METSCRQEWSDYWSSRKTEWMWHAYWLAFARLYMYFWRKFLGMTGWRVEQPSGAGYCIKKYNKIPGHDLSLFDRDSAPGRRLKFSAFTKSGPASEGKTPPKQQTPCRVPNKANWNRDASAAVIHFGCYVLVRALSFGHSYALRSGIKFHFFFFIVFRMMINMAGRKK